MSRPLARRCAPALAAFLLTLLLFGLSPATDRSDSFWVPYTAQSLLEDRDLDLSDLGVTPRDDYALVADGSQVVSYFPWSTAALAVPVVAAWHAAADLGLVDPLGPPTDRRRTDGLQRVGGSLFAAAAATVLALLARRLTRAAHEASRGWAEPERIPVSDRVWFVPLCAVVIASATSLWSTASRGLWQHGPGALVLGGAWLAALSVTPAEGRREDRRPALVSGALAALACGIRPTNAVFVIALGVFVATRRRPAFLSFALGGLATVTAGLAANLALLGSPLQSYFSNSRASLHPKLVTAALSNVLSPSRGLLVYSPWLVLALLAMLPTRRRLFGEDVTTVAWCALATSIAAVLAAASYGERWWAGHSYGPRFLSESVVLLGPVALCVVFGPRPAGSSRRGLSIVASVLITWSALVHLPGASTAVSDCWNRTPIDVDRNPSRVGDWDDAEFAVGWQTLLADGPGASPSACEQRRR